LHKWLADTSYMDRTAFLARDIGNARPS